ncbi:MAG: nucleoside triphosphate pyrophosphohydrolase [Clostridia bacterium]|nr:nucleoside triphosphate pyrophosphohydrolase [Clostridia bacterium]MBQ9714764.1 nucleoside triphosphate pyrophosphohydrolase [Clostridia bacterium]
MITVIGLGVAQGDLSRRGEKIIMDAAAQNRKIVVRTAYTESYKTVQELGVPHVCLDGVYESSRNFATLAKNLAKAVVQQGEDAVYLVDGAATEDNSVKALIKRTRGKVEIVDGVSKTTALVRVAGFGDCSYTAVSAYELAERASEGNLALPLLVYDLDDESLASDCKLILGDLFGEESAVKYLCDGNSRSISLFELDRQKEYNYTSAVALERVDLLKKQRFTMEDLKEIVVRLRAPNGCPWDRVQTCQSIKMSAVEEAYELVDAIDQEDDDKILEEAGDILLQAVFHAILKEETGAFNLTDVLTGICQKLISRHSHVFGEDKAETEGSALSVWEKNKMTEKHQVTFADSVNDVPKCFPAALRAQKIGKRAAKAGLDFADVCTAAKRIDEELQEFFAAYNAGNTVAAEKELGDVLFAVINVGRKSGCDCEKALKESAERFAARFTLAEKKALEDGKTVTELSEVEWDKYYKAAKEELCSL